MKEGKIKVKMGALLEGERVLGSAKWRSNIPTNYAIDRNFDRIQNAVKTYRDAQREEPMCWFFWKELAASKSKKIDEEVDVPTEEQIEKGRAEIERWLQEEIAFQPYRLDPKNLSDGLCKLSQKRETLDEDGLRELNEDFSVCLTVLGLIEDGEE